MRKIIPLIVLILSCVLFSTAQNVNPSEAKLALDLVRTNSAKVGLSQNQIDNFIVSSTFEDKVTGIRYVYLFQAYKGIPVFNQMTVLSFRGGKLLTKSGVYDSGIETQLTGKSASPAITAESAVQSALSDRGFKASQMAIALSRKDDGRMVEFGNMGISRENITAQLMWVPVADFIPNQTVDSRAEMYKLAWQVYIIPKTTSDYWLVRVNAIDNSILGNSNLTDYDNWGTPDDPAVVKYPAFAYSKNLKGKEQYNPFDFKNTDKANNDPSLVGASSYRVIPMPYEAPSFMPGASTTWHAVKSNPWTNATVANATTLNWHTGAGATDYDYSRGNNVWAYEDRGNANAPSVAKSAASQTALPTLTFDFTPDYTQEPTVNTVAVPNQRFNITNLFYWNNIIHDVFYGYGFTEAGGNFQDDNLGRGGVGNDHVNAEAQDGSGTNNANFATPADGGSGKMQMFLWTAPTPDRDGDVDNSIIVHEHGHGIAKRLTGGPANTTCLSNNEQGGEGISDYLALMLTQDWTTATLTTGFTAPRGIGTYALNQPTTGLGIRQRRYTTNFAVNEFTYSNLPTQVVPHGVGQIWCTMLWEMTWEVINEVGSISPNIYSWDGTGGNVRALRMVMEGLRTQPCSPGFVDARNNILLASQTLYGGIYDCAIWRAFARRGVGFSATQGSASSINDQVPAFDLPPACLAAGPPTVTINQAATQLDPTGTSPINFTVVFSEAVTGFTSAGVNLSGTAGATTKVVTGGPTTYNVAVSGMTTNGTVIANVPANAATGTINVVGNLASTSTDNTVTYNTALPAICTTFVSSITAADPATSLRFFRDGIPKTCAAPGACAAGLAGSFNYKIFQWTSPAAQCVSVSFAGTNANQSFVSVYNAAPVLTNLCTNWVADPGSSALVGAPIVFSFNATAGTTYYFLVTNISTLPADCTIEITAANCAGATAPAVTINQAATQLDPTSVSPINFTVVFSEPVTGFTAAGVTLAGTAGATTKVVTGGPATYNVAVSGMASSGTVIATVPANVATGTVNPVGNTASTSTDNTVTYSTVCVPPTVNTPPNQVVCALANTAPVNFTGTPTAIFNWTNNNTAIGLAASGTGNIPSFVATNTTAAPIVGTITVTPSLPGGGPSGPITFTSPTLINVPQGQPATTSGPAGPYPSPITVSGLPTTGVSVQSITLTNIQHSWSGDIDVLLVSPTGQQFMPMSRVGGSTGFDVTATIILKDGSPAMPTTSTAIPSGTYGPTAGSGTTTMPAGAPAGPYNLAAPGGTSTFANVFNNTTNYNGTWNLYIADHSGGDFGTISGGWGLTLFAPAVSTCIGTPVSFTITVNPNPAIVIIADPGTTICEGDPTLLTVYNGAGGNATIPLPAQVSTFGSNVRGYWFTAPNNFTMTALRVPTDASAGNQHIAVVRFTGATPPPAFPGTTNAFTTLFLTQNNPAVGNIPVNIPIVAGDVIGIFGDRGADVNSYGANGPYVSMINGTPVTLTRMGMQFPLATTAPQQIWQEAAFGISRVFFDYSTVTTGGIATGTFLWSPAAGLSSTTSNPVAASPMNTTTYTVVRTGVGGCQSSASITITVNKRPVVTTQPVSRTNCEGNTATFTVGGTGTGLTYQWQQNTSGCTGGTWTNLTNTAPYSGVNTATLTVNPVTVAMSGYGYRCVLSGTCTPFTPPTNVSNCATLTVNPNPTVAITPAGPVCGGVAGLFGTLLSTGSSAPPVPGTCTTASGAISVAVPDGSAAGIQSTLAVSCVPANATITGMRVNFNMPGHTYVGDMIFNLKAPNGTVLNLVKYMSGTATQAGTYPNSGFVNTTISSAGTAVLGTATTTPITGTWKADLLNGTIPFTIQDPAGFPSTATAWTQLYSVPNGTWTLAMADGGAGDVGTLTSWSIIFDYTTPGSGGGPVLSYVWSPLTGLYTNATATIPYTGTNLPSVYAAPVAQTTYTVRATNVATGCFTDASVLVNYTPPAPTVTPNPVTMCLGDSAVKLKSSSSQAFSSTFTSGAVNIVIPDGPTIPPVPTSYPATTSNITVSGIPAGATIANLRVKFNITHVYVSDLVIALKAPNGSIINLSALLNRTNGPGANFTNTVISSAGTAAQSSGTAPFTGTFKADLAGATFTALGFTWPGGPTGYVPTSTNWNSLYSTANGVWSVGIYDAGAPDGGVLNNWSLDVDYIVGVPTSAAVWTPAAGLFSNAAATIPYVAGTMVDSVWTRPTPAGVYNYQVTVNNLITTNATPTTPLAGGNGNNLVAFNVRNNNAYPVPFNSISSNTFGSGAVTSRVFYKITPIAGNPGPISVANGWNQFGAGASTVTAGTNNLLISGLSLVLPAGATYGIALDMSGATFPAYTNGTGTIQTYSDRGVDIITDGNVGWGGPIAPGTPANNPRNFNGSVSFGGTSPGTCTSPARTVVITVNTPATIVTQPVNQTICTDKVATFTVVPAGSGPFTYQWQVSTNSGNNPWTNITNGGVYSGATTATLTITAPPVSYSGNHYRVIVQGAAPCGSVTSLNRILTVNPLPTVVISASPTSLYPGLVANFTSTVTPNAAGPNGYVWLRDGAVLSASSIGINSGIGTGSLAVNVDGLGVYQLRVTDVNGCTNVSNQITIKDSVTAKCFIYPNPTSGTFEVRYYSVTGNSNLPRYLTVYDAKGDRVYSKLYSIGRPYDRMPVDMRAYGKGLYWVEIGDANGNRLAMCRLVIQ